jgi:hypothetical protein
MRDQDVRCVRKNQKKMCRNLGRRQLRRGGISEAALLPLWLRRKHLLIIAREGFSSLNSQEDASMMQCVNTLEPFICVCQRIPHKMKKRKYASPRGMKRQKKINDHVCVCVREAENFRAKYMQ